MAVEQKLSRKSRALIESFDSDAQSWGWESDQGNGKAVDRAKKAYESSKAELEAHVLQLERRVKTLQAKNKVLA